MSVRFRLSLCTNISGNVLILFFFWTENCAQVASTEPYDSKRHLEEEAECRTFLCLPLSALLSFVNWAKRAVLALLKLSEYEVYSTSAQGSGTKQ